MRSRLALTAAGISLPLMLCTHAYASSTRREIPTNAAVISVSQFNDDITDPVERWNIADRTNDEEMSAALDYMLAQIAQKPEASLHDLETDDAVYLERNESAFDKFIEVLWYSKNMELKKKIVQVWAEIDDWPKVERMFRQSGSQITSEKILFAIAHLRDEVRHSRYHFDSGFVANLETIERRIQRAPSDSRDQS
jgi:hypothetical protein